MFKIITTINLITFLFGVPTHTPIEIADNHGIYSTAMIVDFVEYDESEDCYEVEMHDSNGNWWYYYDDDACDIYVGDLMAITMDDNGTENIYDDIILDVKATGFYFD